MKPSQRDLQRTKESRVTVLWEARSEKDRRSSQTDPFSQLIWDDHSDLRLGRNYQAHYEHVMSLIRHKTVELPRALPDKP
jgi:hypothetical protein